MAERQDLLTALEVCRPGSADLELPELAELKGAVQTDPTLALRLEAVQRWDEAVREAVLLGEVPAALQDRVLAALRTAEESSTQPEQATRAADPAGSARIGRRRLWISLVAAAAVAAVAAGVTLWSVLMDSEPLASTTIYEEAAQWCDGLATTGWRTSGAPRDFPFPVKVVASPDAWQPISVPGVEEAVAFHLPSPGPSVRRITVLVLKAQAPGLGPFPPKDPYMTMDRLVAAWQIGGNVYVLVMQGDDLGALHDVYQRYVDTHVSAA